MSSARKKNFMRKKLMLVSTCIALSSGVAACGASGNEKEVGMQTDSKVQTVSETTTIQEESNVQEEMDVAYKLVWEDNFESDTLNMEIMSIMEAFRKEQIV